MPIRLAAAVARSVEAVSAGGARFATPPAPPIFITLGGYRARLATAASEREAACRLRFRVFNLELGNGLDDSWRTGLDQDCFDAVCDHLIVEDLSRGEIVGTYRMQSGLMAAENCGYYSQQEFDLSCYQAIRAEVLELGRASIDREHRSSEVLTLLWRGIAQYARTHGLRYLLGCSSLNSSEPQAAWSIYRQLSACVAPQALCTRPLTPFELPPFNPSAEVDAVVPRLLRTYIAVGARICAEPAWDREFGTMDFLTLLDLERLSPAARNRFLPEAAKWSRSSAPPCGC